LNNQKEINGRTYSFGMIPAMEALQVEVSIARVIGEPLFRAFMDQKKTGLSKEEAEAAGAAAIGLIASRMNADDLTVTIERVMKYVSCDGKRIEIDSHFTGKNKELWQVFIAALQFNFSDFLPESLFISVHTRLKSLS
jgi:uridylate kinase